LLLVVFHRYERH